MSTARMPVRNRVHNRSLDADVTGIGLSERDRNFAKAVRVRRPVSDDIQMRDGIKPFTVIGKADFDRRRSEYVVQFVNKDADGD